MHENRFRQANLFKFLDKTVLVFPVDGCALAIKQPGLGHRIGAGAKSANRNPLARFTAQPVQDRFGGRLLNIDSTANQNGIFPLGFIKPHVQTEGRPVGADRLPAVFARQRPLIDRPANNPVRNAQWFDCAGERQECKAVKQQEHKPAARVLVRRLFLAARHVCLHNATQYCRFAHTTTKPGRPQGQLLPK